MKIHFITMNAELLPIDKYPHSQIIERSKINISELDEDLKITIQGFNKKYKGVSLKKNQDGLNELMALSNIIGQKIYDYYVDTNDQDVDIDPNYILTQKDIKDIADDIKEADKDATVDPVNPAPDVVPPVIDADPQPQPQETFINNNEKALSFLFSKGRLKDIAISELREAGFNTSSSGPLSIRGCRVGKYHIYKEFSETVYNLKKNE